MLYIELFYRIALFSLPRFSTGNVQGQLRNFFFEFFEASMLFSEMDQKLLIEWTYKGEFAGLIFILETLTVLKTQLTVDFSYQMLIDLDFSLITFDVGSMVLDFDFFTNLLNGFGLPQATHGME